ncbi:MAG: hypothetical protein RL172_1189 [Bacteroidota bacterium]|jgi:membrane protein
MKRLTDWWQILTKTAHTFIEYSVPRMSAALSYYTLFSIAPILLIIISISGIFFGREAVEGSLFGQIKNYVGADAAMQIQAIIKNAANSQHGKTASILSFAVLLFTATGVFTEIQDSINTIWQLKAKPRKGWVRFLVNRMLSLSMILGLGFILLVSLVLNAGLDILMRRLLILLPEASFWLTYGVNMLITFMVISFLFAVIFKFLPDAKIQWKDVRTGAFITAGLFMIAKLGIGFYLGKSNPASTYGAAGYLVLLLLWVYFSAMTLYFGACFTKVYAQHSGRQIFPDNYAVFVQHIEVQNKESLQGQADTTVVDESETTGKA